MMRRLIIFLLFPLHAFGQNVEWASTVVAYSSQATDKVYSAQQALGKPSRLPSTGRTTCAWMPKATGDLTYEYLVVSFKNPITAKQIIVAENFNPGHIYAVSVFDSVNAEHKVYERTSEPFAISTGRLFQIPLKDQKSRIFMVKLIFDKADAYNTYQVDAVGLDASSEPYEVRINVAEEHPVEKAQSLGPEINSEFDEIYPIISPDGTELFIDRKLYPQNTGDQKFDDIWVSKFAGDKWQTAVNEGPPLNDDGYNFLCSISPDGNSAMVGGNFGDGPGIAFTYKTENGWSVPVPARIDNFQNLNSYNEFNLGSDGVTLIMSIETIASFGLRDLYVSFKTAEGQFSTPRNIGNDVNTAGDEMSPFLAADGKTLYFSSNGHPGYGGPDIFMSKRLDDTWTHWSEPVNLGPAVNTPEYDVYYSVDAKGEYAYFASSYTSKTNLDIFRMKLPPTAQPEFVIWLKGNVRDRISGDLISARVEVLDLNDSLTAYSNSTPGSDYAVLISSGEEKRVRVTAPGYYNADTLISTGTLGSYSELIQNYSLIPRKSGTVIELNHIEFEANSSILADTSFAELDKVVKFLRDNPGVSIEVRGHTNGLCDDNYCNSLSLRRAQSVVDYFVSKGIATNRLTAKGFGKSVPIADNNTAEGRRRNQRVEFMITKTD